jgi:HNH endonuclease
MDRKLRDKVRARADNHCEYCRLPQMLDLTTPFHVEHIIAEQHDGGSEFDNLALACCWCNAIKGPNLASLDPDTGDLVRLFHPRRDQWHDHFERDGPQIHGRTDVGRTTVFLLRFNSAINVQLRSLQLAIGESLD